MSRTEKTGLTTFTRPEKSFAERFVDAVFDRDEGKPVGERFAEAYSDRSYLPNVIDAQHWAVDALNEGNVEKSETRGEFDLMTEIFCRFFVQYDLGNMSLEEAKSRSVEMAQQFFAGSDQQKMFDGLPEDPIWFALHIYRICEEAERLIHDNVEERTELDKMAGDVHDLYVSKDDEERDQERRNPFVTLMNAGVKVGFLYRDAWWKTNHEKAAQEYYALAAARAKGSPRGGDATAQKYAALKEDCLAYFIQAYREKGVGFIGAPVPVVAKTIREIALRDRPDDFVGPSGAPLAERWFRETLEGFQAEGRFGAAIKAALREA